MIDRHRLESVVAEAGRIAFDLWPGRGGRVRAWEKAPGDPVSEADIAVDSFLKRELGRLLPAAGWLSEETADAPARLEGDLVWLVDPIDGTRDFLRGRRGWAVSVALVRGNRPLIAMLCAPAREEMWRAEAGQGAWRNDVRLAASTRSALAGARLPADQLARADRGFEAVPKPNSIALRIAMVAADEADAVVGFKNSAEWDLAAAALIAREAGAAVSDRVGGPLVFNQRVPRIDGVVVAAPAIHAAVLAHFDGRGAG